MEESGVQKRLFCIWMTLVVLLSVMVQTAGPKYVTHFFVSTEVRDGQPDRNLKVGLGIQQNTAVQLIPVAAWQNTKTYTTRETSGQKAAEYLARQSFRRLRYVQQQRHWMDVMASECSACLGLAIQYALLGCKEQKELLSVSRLIVDFICRADGKKDGISSLIK